MRHAKSLIKKFNSGLAQTVSELRRQLVRRHCFIIMNFSALQTTRLVPQMASPVPDKLRIQRCGRAHGQCTHQCWVTELIWPSEYYR